MGQTHAKKKKGWVTLHYKMRVGGRSSGNRKTAPAQPSKTRKPVIPRERGERPSNKKGYVSNEVC